MEIYKDLGNSASKEFEKMLNSQLSKIKIEEGKIIEGKINKITEKFVFIYVEGLKSEPVLDVNELNSLGLKDKVKIQLGGGIRNLNDIDFWIENSVNRIILGTMALENPNFINQLDKKYFKKIVIGADVRNGNIASHGWKKQSNVIAVDLIKALNPLVLNSVIYTDITKDGSLQGVNLDQTVNFAKSIPHPVIASGGVSSLGDVSRLAKEFVNGVQGVIIGRALYDKRFTFSDALQKCKEAIL